MKETFENISKERIAGILNTAMDDGEWHTPSVSDINIRSQTISAIYGWCNISKHNTYNDKEVWFNINKNNVKIWVKEYERGKIDRSLFRPIYNFKQLGAILETLSTEEPKSLKQ